MSLEKRFFDWCSEHGILDDDMPDNYVNFALDQDLSVEEMREFLGEVNKDGS